MISGALHLGIFDQPEKNWFSTGSQGLTLLPLGLSSLQSTLFDKKAIRRILRKHSYS
jgi:hypothetical protein